MKRFIICITICFAFAINGRSTLAQQYYFDSWTTDNGLPQNSVNAILQTRDGYLWIATADGLVRYDGAQFTVFNQGNTPGINDNRCYDLVEDRSGVLWIRNQFGLISYRDGVFHSYTYADSDLPEGVFQFFEDGQDGLILISTKGIFLWRDGRSSRLDPEAHAPLSSPGYKDRSGRIWCNAGRSLACLTTEGRLMQYPKAVQEPYGWIACIHEDRRGDFWVGTYTGLYRLVSGEFVHYGLPGGLDRTPIQSISEDPKGVLWISTIAGGLFQLAIDQASAATAPPASIDFNPAGAPAGNHASAIFFDREGTMWLGTNLDGLLRANKQVVTVYSKQDGLSSDNVYPVYQDRQGAVWIGNWQGRPTVFKNGKFTQSGEWTLPAAFAEDRDGNLWMGK
ncbi:MAG: ligand-binding sensor domain-containing protein, partial [Blastocatellia bacterium]